MGLLCLGGEELRRRILTLFPNALTVMNAVMGILSVFFAYKGRIREAFLILIGAALFDKLDGALARKLGLTEPTDTGNIPKPISMGSILDDISDAVSFCIVPAWIFYLCLSEASAPIYQSLPIGVIAWLYALLGITRLIHFTLDRNPIPGYFKGLPTSAAALLVVASLMMFKQQTGGLPNEVRFWALFCIGVMVFASLLMNIYPIRYIHYGSFMDRHPVFLSLNVILSIVFLFTQYFEHFALIWMFLYVLSPLCTWRITPEVAPHETRNKEA